MEQQKLQHVLFLSPYTQIRRLVTFKVIPETEVAIGKTFVLLKKLQKFDKNYISNLCKKGTFLKK